MNSTTTKILQIIAGIAVVILTVTVTVPLVKQSTDTSSDLSLSLFRRAARLVLDNAYPTFATAVRNSSDSQSVTNEAKATIYGFCKDAHAITERAADYESERHLQAALQGVDRGCATIGAKAASGALTTADVLAVGENIKDLRYKAFVNIANDLDKAEDVKLGVRAKTAEEDVRSMAKWANR